MTNQQPYIASNACKEANAPLQLPIKTQNRYSVPGAAESLNQLSQVLISPRKQSPARNSNSQQLTVLCNVSTPNNNQYSSSSSSSKSPGPPRSRSPSINKYDFQENKYSNESNKSSQIPQESLIRFQSESFSKINKYYSTINTSTLINSAIKRSFKSTSKDRERKSSSCSFILSSV